MYYTDPGSGALLWQILGSTVFAIAFYFSRMRHWVMSKFFGRTAEEPQQIQSRND